MAEESSGSGNASKEKEILDLAARLAAYARKGNVSKSQINGMIEFLNSLSEGKYSLLYLVAYVLRQSGRTINRDFANEFKRIVVDLYNKKYSKGDVVKLLGLMKWIVEALENNRVFIRDPRKIDDFETLIGYFR